MRKMKITLDIKENKETGNINVTINELKKNKTTKDSEFNTAVAVYNAICKALKEMEK